MYFYFDAQAMIDRFNGLVTGDMSGVVIPFSIDFNFIMMSMF
mgnify:CR=1 FL=1